MGPFNSVRSPEFSFTHSGLLSIHQVSALNPFRETADQVRITADALQRPYPCLHSQSDGKPKGYSQGVASFLANAPEARGANVAGDLGPQRLV